MTKDNRKEYFEELEKKSREITKQVALEEDESGYICRAAFSTMKDAEGICFFETQIFDVWEDMPVLEIRVIPQFVISESGMDQVREMVQQMNLHMPLGTLGIHFATGHLFWRMSIPADTEKTAADFAAYTIKLYEKTATIIGAIYEPMRRVAAGESSFAEEVEAGNLVDQ
ncbi:MAG: hypothetical protein J5819_05045 [Eubacterium sp.]|nr:hypothetical protein [Eubacterium sp.]